MTSTYPQGKKALGHSMFKSALPTLSSETESIKSSFFSNDGSHSNSK
eukprot:CAMPEP_0197236512 /NCGR_PEP_ID=MMETSP1429-20130617/3590_1 /TAXON_ID=49237 /ORGANISM="Chaetoceros  sp., Strain UNC1202" /LENGTH=46 /DNA_ID= /DNA_START= /DNA_END= /DNA_ORIENTATION=